MNRTLRTSCFLLVALAMGCAESMTGFTDDGRLDTAASDDLLENDTATDADLPEFTLQVVPFVSDRVLLSTAFGPFTTLGDYELSLSPPVTLSGTLTAAELSPTYALAPLPTVAVPPAAQINLLQRSPGTREHYTATDGDGNFSVDLAAPSTYDLQVVPEDPDLPVYEQGRLVLVNGELHHHLVGGVSLWGTLTAPSGDPVASATVELSGPSGRPLRTTTTAADGRYAFQVTPGSYQLLVDDAFAGTSPRHELGSFEVGETGLRHDAELQPSDTTTLRGHVTAPNNGQALGAVPVQIVGTSFEGISTEASLERTIFTSTQGEFQTTLPRGTYTITIAPDDDTHTAAFFDDVALASNLENVGTIELPTFTPLDTVVYDLNGSRVEGAQLACTEVGGSERFWEAQSDSVGALTLSLPASEVDCLLSPPGRRTDLATRRLLLAGDDRPDSLNLTAGQLLSGTVLIVEDDGSTTTLPDAAVQMRDAEGRVWASPFTDDDGAWSTRVDWESHAR